MTSPTYEDARHWAAHWCQRWFLGPDGADLLQVDGVDAGWASHIDAYEALLRFALRRFRHHGRSAPSFTRLTKERGFDRALRALGLQAVGSSGATRDGSATGSVAVVIEIPTPSMLESLVLLARHLGTERSSVVTTDPRAFRLLDSRGVRPLSLGGGWRDARAAVSRAKPAIQSGWAAVESLHVPMLLGGRDERMDALESLRPLVTRSLPWIGADIAAAASFLDVGQPTAIALASDQHRTGRVVTQLAERRGIPVVVLQHGLPQAAIGYLPVVAPTVATWSAASRQWFVDAGTDPDRLKVLGNPRFDEFAANGPAADGPEGRPRMLLALSPTSPAVNSAAASLAVRALQDLPAASLVIKLHPGQGDWGHVRRLVRASPVAHRVNLRRRSSLAPLLRWADVTLIHRSTVAVDSLAAGKPVVVLDVGPGQHPPQRELSELDPPVADNPRRLVEIVVELARDRSAFFSSRTAAVESLVGPVDGMATSRIADYLLGNR